MINKTLIFIVLWLLPLWTKEYADTIENFKVIKVRDGDTFVITIEDTPDVFGEEIAVRIRATARFSEG